VSPQYQPEWQNFANSADIEPLGYPYGYQLELPFTEPSEVQGRLFRFFEDPRNIRGLFGNVSRDELGNLLPEAERIQRAVNLKRDIRGNPKLMQDLQSLAQRGGATAAAGLEDAYSLRQLSGEEPGVYGDPNPTLASEIERGVAGTTPGTRVRYDDPSIPTQELSPANRTRQTSVSLRPSYVNEDIRLLYDPAVTSQFYAPHELADSLVGRTPFMRHTLGRPELYEEPVYLEDALRNPDNEGIRSLMSRSPLGVTEVAGEFPGQFADDLQELLRDSSADQDYIYDYLRRTGSLPAEASEPREVYDSDLNNGPYEGQRYTSYDIERQAEGLPEQKKVLDYRGSGSGQRVGKDQLYSEYGKYLPANYSKLSLDETANVLRYLTDSGDPNLATVGRRFWTNLPEIGATRSLERAISGVNDLVLNPQKREAANTYLTNYLSDLGSKTVDVPIRSAGVGGGAYLNSMEVQDIYPSASEKLDFFSGKMAYVPEDFEPTISETFYSKTGRPYVVEVNRDPAYGSLTPDKLNENVASLINDKPYAGVYNIDFSVDGSYQDVNVPDELKDDIMKFVKQSARQGIPAGAVVRNAPAGNETGRTGGSKGNKRSLWYQQLGFGAATPAGQFGYIDPDTGNTVPIQPYRSDFPSQGTETFKRSYYGLEPISVTAQALRKNPLGTAGGAALTLLNDEVAKSLAKDDYKAAGVAVAKDVLGGAALEAGLKHGAAPLLQRVAPATAARVIPAVTTAARYGIPAAVGAGLFSQGKTGSALDVLTNKAATVVPGLKANPQTDVGRRAGKTISNEAKYVLNSILQNRVPYLKGRLF